MATYSAVIAAMLSRIVKATGAAGLLAGVRVVEFPVAETDADVDLPAVRCLSAPFSEQWTPGNPTRASLTVAFQVAANRAKGFANLIATAEALMNALEVDEKGIVDPLLGGMLLEPMSFRSDQLPATELSISQTVIVTANPAKLIQRGKR